MAEGFQSTSNSHNNFEVLEHFNVRKVATIDADAHEVIQISLSNGSFLQFFEIGKERLETIYCIKYNVILLFVADFEVSDYVVMTFKIIKVIQHVIDRFFNQEFPTFESRVLDAVLILCRVFNQGRWEFLVSKTPNKLDQWVNSGIP